MATISSSTSLISLRGQILQQSELLRGFVTIRIYFADNMDMIVILYQNKRVWLPAGYRLGILCHRNMAWESILLLWFSQKLPRKSVCVGTVMLL